MCIYCYTLRYAELCTGGWLCGLVCRLFLEVAFVNRLCVSIVCVCVVMHGYLMRTQNGTRRHKTARECVYIYVQYICLK